MPQTRPVQQQQQEQHALGPINHAPLQTQPSRVMACRQIPQGFTFLKAFTLKWWVLGASRSSGYGKKGPEVNQVNTGVLERRQGQRRKNWPDRGKTKASTPVGRKCLKTKNSIGLMGQSCQAPRLGVPVDRAQTVTADSSTQAGLTLHGFHSRFSSHSLWYFKVQIKLQLRDQV